MARSGITYHDVAKAAQQLVGEQRNPTIENIRLVLKTGSSSTIAQHLRHWKAEQNSIQFTANQAQLPEELIALMQGLWERVMAQARIEIETQQQQADENIQLIEVKYQTLQQEYSALQQQAQQLEQHHRQLHNDKLGVEHALKKQSHENAALEATLRAHANQLHDKQGQVDELTQTKRQLQTNLEHYRETVREQRAEQQKVQIQEIQQLEQAFQQQIECTNDYKQQCRLLNDKLSEIQQDQRALAEKHNDIIKENYELETNHQLLQAKHHQQTEVLNHYQQEAQSLSARQENQNEKLQTAEKQLAQQAQQITSLAQQLEQSQQQHQSLAHEKWILGQERAQLQGQLKQLEALAVRTT